MEQMHYTEGQMDFSKIIFAQKGKNPNKLQLKCRFIQHQPSLNWFT